MVATPNPARQGIALLIGALWLAAAIGAGATGVLEPLPRAVLQGVLIAMTVLLLVGAFGVKPVREWANALPLRALVGLHLTRAVAGARFLYLYQQGRLPYAFAVPGGWGDIAVAALAVGVLAIDPNSTRKRVVTLIWNVIGLIDILMVVITAARLGVKDPPSMVELARLPLCVLPLFLVPLIIASHIVIFARLRSPKRE